MNPVKEMERDMDRPDRTASDGAGVLSSFGRSVLVRRGGDPGDVQRSTN